PYKATTIAKPTTQADTTNFIAQTLAKPTAAGLNAPTSSIVTTGNPAADNPDKAIIRASSQDLATLLSAQQLKNNPVAPNQPTTAVNAAVQTQTPNQVGLGPVITATSFTGANIILQVLDPSVSQASPQQVAEVLAQSPIAAADVKSLPISLLNASAASELVKLETDKGAFIVPAKDAANLQGELVKVSTPEVSAVSQGAEQVKNKATTPSYEAKLTAVGTGAVQTVQVHLQTASEYAATTSTNNSTVGSQQAGTSAEITAVHTLRAFLSPSGPRSDIRLETPLG
ncbi:MAG: hypothetical protein OIF57_10570, partial [Marinobacterium sp.]|nr:hypothetical protein [Marinobacterium sp.]